MTVATTNSTQTFSGGQQTLTFNFRTLVSSPQYVQVSVIALTGGTVTLLVYNVGYTVAVNASGIGGTVTVSPTFGTNFNYIVFRQTSITQSSAYSDYNAFPASTVENNLDQLTMIEQEFNTNQSLLMTYPVGTSTTFSTTMPVPSVGCVVTCNSGGTQWVASAGIAGPQGATGPSGSSITLSSSTTDLTIVTTSTTATLTVVAATAGSNTILKLDGTGKLPGLNASLLTSIFSSISNYLSSTGSSSLVSLSTIKIAYGNNILVSNGGTLITSLPFSSSTSYLAFGSSLDQLHAISCQPSSGTTMLIYDLTSTSHASWFAWGI